MILLITARSFHSISFLGHYEVSTCSMLNLNNNNCLVPMCNIEGLILGLFLY